MTPKNRHSIRTVVSSIDINGRPEIIWDNITNVKMEQFSYPTIFKLLHVPKPLKAEIISEGQGRKRIAYFDNGKKFIQEILVWKPFKEYSFSFNPEKGFRVCGFFELSEGVFQIPTGAYYLETIGQTTTIRLTTNFSIDRRLYFLLNIPAHLILKAIHSYVLTSIRKNSE
jgi:hypothetical protein